MNDITYQTLMAGHHLVGFVTLLALCSERLMVLMIIFPPTADGVLQGRVRTALALLWSVFVAWGQQGFYEDSTPLLLVAIGIKEALLGLVFGFAASSVFWAAESVGVYVDDLAGYNNVQMQNPSQGQQSSLTSALLSQFAIAAFWLLGGMTFLLGALYDSYRWWPLGALVPAGGQVLESFVLHQTDSLMETVAKLAAPMMLMLLLVDIGFGFTSKMSQKLELGSLAQPVKGALTILLLALLAGVFLAQVRGQIALTGLSAQAQALSRGEVEGDVVGEARAGGGKPSAAPAAAAKGGAQ
ncbi:MULTISPECIES: type III secretion system export apparatus subunit SctT [unclassified Paraburkholderia]|uniref:type III secretion system export apparatus subunit SctT n=1 Tax=unclassified Paraburkholderia TaxID=2615204 RepID=UPI002AB2775F|nr:MULTISPECIES: type III secretion system export apparatus subunit SctT [unclassified Paraburkholderia]